MSQPNVPSSDDPETMSRKLPGNGLRKEPDEHLRPRSRVDLAIAGPTGMVGSALLRLLEEKVQWLAAAHGIELCITGAINRRGMIWDEKGTSPQRIPAQLSANGGAHWDSFAEHVRGHRGCPLVFLDCTASEFIARQYRSVLESGVSIVTPNKIANTLELSYYEELRRLSRGRNVRYYYETTVGAATPMIRTLEDLRRTGDTIGRIEGVFSGTLSYVFSAVNRGEIFSHAVREAVQRGLTEPHPALDLSGEDVARKLLILAREAGYRLERDDIHVEGLVPPELREIADPHQYVERLSAFDERWSDLAAKAQSRRARLAYLARFDGAGAVVGIAEVSVDSPFVRLHAGENAVHYYSDRHRSHPLTIQGMGGGPEITARGVIADVIQTAIEVTATKSQHR